MSGSGKCKENLNFCEHYGAAEKKQAKVSAAASGWAGWALAHPEFGSSVNPITTRGADYAHPLLLAHQDLKTQRHL